MKIYFTYEKEVQRRLLCIEKDGVINFVQIPNDPSDRIAWEGVNNWLMVSVV